MKRANSGLNRRQFIQGAGSLAALGVANAAGRGVSIVLDPHDPVAGAAPAQWAAKELERSLTARGLSVQMCDNLSQAKAGDFCVLAAGLASRTATPILRQARAVVASVPEALGLVLGTAGNRQLVLACGFDTRAVVYALLELADRAQNNADPVAALAVTSAITERPANRVRSLTRLFTSDVEDKPWYNDREMWPQYLTMLAAQRYNRFNLAFGIGYDFIRQVTDAYFLFTYPFLLSVPGYNVRSPQLPDAERDHNLEMLKFISEQTVARGIEFQVGLWMHGYEWIDSPHPNYTIEGLNKDNHASYCRDAVRMLLKACPAISGVTFRVHGESGVAEGSYDFWKTVFDGVATCGRTVRIDMHAKGMDQSMLDMAVATHQPVTLSPKFWAEHLGMTYHQADIRELERPKPGRQGSGLMKLSSGSRSFLRYGYGDLLREDRPWSVVHRIWPGTQRVLLWGDPVTAAAYSRAFSFCGSAGVEIQEPLSFKGRRGSGIAGDRCAYADTSLRPRWDWQKYVYGHRVWGRMLYNPNTAPDVWRRYLRAEFKSGAELIEAALSNASRILPIITTGHATSAGNNTYWPEVYLNQSMVDAEHFQPYTDTPSPRVFGNVSPLDPQLFSRINDFADEMLSGERSGKYSPIEVAQWIEDYAEAAAKNLALAERQTEGKERPEYRRLAIDVAIQSGLGRFFGAKFRAGVLYRIYEKTGDADALKQSLAQYRKARTAWSEVANRAKGVYMSDITVGEHPQLRGHWLDRLPAMDRDIAAVEAKSGAAQSAPNSRTAQAIQEALGRPVRPALAASHEPATTFRPGEPLNILLTLEKPAASVKLYYRHVDQAERYEAVEMEAQQRRYRSSIPGSYTNSVFPLEYYFEVRESPESATIYPGLSANLTQRPYFVVRRA
ncbi:MAG TPA: hypothetical protein VG675_23945 [Bryobacteraceae bacterium]|nr:hypothetical protein [Bryobacteraceae bacterium]